ncbi:hypothetical protein [Amnibacterium setariae]|nr:hypothetical protein [Amnibacterium setariae]
MRPPTLAVCSATILPRVACGLVVRPAATGSAQRGVPPGREWHAERVHATEQRDERDAARLDALRRRLYAPDVTEADVAAYRAAQARAEDAPAAHPVRAVRRTSPAAASAARPEVSRRTALVAAGGGAAAIAAAVVVLTGRPFAGLVAQDARPAPTATARRIGAAVLPASLGTRRRFVAALQGGGQAGLLEYLYGHPVLLPASMRSYARADSTEYSGQGTTTIALAPSRLAEAGGRFTVVLVTDRAATFSWRAERIAERNDRSGPVVLVGSHAGSGRAGEPTSFTFAYDVGAPLRLVVYTDETVKWGAVVAFTE